MKRTKFKILLLLLVIAACRESVTITYPPGSCPREYLGLFSNENLLFDRNGGCQTSTYDISLNTWRLDDVVDANNTTYHILFGDTINIWPTIDDTPVIAQRHRANSTVTQTIDTVIGSWFSIYHEPGLLTVELRPNETGKERQFTIWWWDCNCRETVTIKQQK